jgi:hypothetical protein
MSFKSTARSVTERRNAMQEFADRVIAWRDGSRRIECGSLDRLSGGLGSH